MIAVLSGGTGGAKLIYGISSIIDPTDLVIICNTADDFTLHGLKISPDLDTIMYTLAGLSDTLKGWGVRDDSFTVLQQLEQYGAETWFNLGDKDLATHITRTQWLRDGKKLSEITAKLCNALGVRAKILPMADETVETRITTIDRQVSFQEYFVKQRWQPEVKKVSYAGIKRCRPAPGVLTAIREACAIIVAPSNPVTSIGPILAVPGIREALRGAAAPVIGVSPVIGNAAISGPAHKLMEAQGLEASACGVARAYKDFLDFFVIDNDDKELGGRIESLGIGVLTSSIRIQSAADKSRLAREVLAFVEK